MYKKMKATDVKNVKTNIFNWIKAIWVLGKPRKTKGKKVKNNATGTKPFTTQSCV